MWTCYITDRSGFSGGESGRQAQLLRMVAEASRAGVDYIQLREKDLPPRALEELARQALRAVRDHGQASLLINHRTDVALAMGADGVHLTGDDIAIADVRTIAAKAGRTNFLVGISCHSPAEVHTAAADGADLALLAPIFEKASANLPGIGLEALRAVALAPHRAAASLNPGAPRPDFRLFALGGITPERAAYCAETGADGVAGIRLFQESTDLHALVRSLHAL